MLPPRDKQPSRQAPVRYRAPGHIARPDADLVTLPEGGDDGGKGVGIVGEIRVHLDKGVVAAVEAPGETVPVGAAETELAGPGQDVHTDRASHRSRRRSWPCRPGCRRRRRGSDASGSALRTRSRTFSIVAASLKVGSTTRTRTDAAYGQTRKRSTTARRARACQELRRRPGSPRRGLDARCSAHRSLATTWMALAAGTASSAPTRPPKVDPIEPA